MKEGTYNLAYKDLKKMAYHKPIDIDGFVSLMAKADMRAKTQLAEDLITYLSDQDNSIISNDLGLLIDSLMPWLTGSHYKVIFFCSILQTKIYSHLTLGIQIQ